jgi:hypothetical protein
MGANDYGEIWTKLLKAPPEQLTDFIEQEALLLFGDGRGYDKSAQVMFNDELGSDRVRIFKEGMRWRAMLTQERHAAAIQRYTRVLVVATVFGVLVSAAAFAAHFWMPNDLPLAARAIQAAEPAQGHRTILIGK